MGTQTKKKRKTTLKHRKMQTIKSWLVLVLHLIGWFLDQSQSWWKQINTIPDYYQHWIENSSSYNKYNKLGNHNFHKKQKQDKIQQYFRLGVLFQGTGMDCIYHNWAENKSRVCVLWGQKIHYILWPFQRPFSFFPCNRWAGQPWQCEKDHIAKQFSAFILSQKCRY